MNTSEQLSNGTPRRRYGLRHDRRREPASQQAVEEPAGAEPRRRRPGATAAGALGSGALVLASLVMTIGTLIAVLIALAIVLRDVDANQTNTVVKGIHEGANFFAGAFTGMITFAGHPEREISVDWGIAAIAFLAVGAVIAGWIARVGRGGLRYESRRRATV